MQLLRRGHEAAGGIVHRRRAGTFDVRLCVAVVASFIVVAGGAATPGCSNAAMEDDSLCLNDNVNGVPCCSTAGACASGYDYVEGAPKCGERITGGGNKFSTCCVPSSASPATPAPAEYSCGSDVCPNNGGALWAKVLGQSGKIDLATSSNVASDPDKIRFEIDALRELDSSGVVLGQGGSEKHSFNSFATQSFTFGAVEGHTYYGLECVKVPFSATLATNSRIGIDIFLFKQAGTLTIGDETFSVTNKTMKFNVELSQWKWCAGDCTSSDGTGAALELDIKVSSKQTAVEKASGSRLYDMGSNAIMRLSKRVQVDELWQDLPDNGPTVTGSGSTTKITLKFPRFNTRLLYDPDLTYCQGAADQCQVRTHSRALACQHIVLLRTLLLFLLGFSPLS